MTTTVPQASPHTRGGRNDYAGQLNAYERLGRGALLLDRAARVLDMNGCVQLGDGLELSDNRLRASHAADALRLRRFLTTILKTGSHSAECTTLVLPRSSSSRPWVLDGIRCNDSPSTAGGVAALLLITDFERPRGPTRARLTQVFGMTPTEAALAEALASGRSLQDAAALQSISEAHARQRLKAIFAKTATSRQAQLTALLAKFE
jgi:DNA-binding CsgD family transcriptional regulator